MRHTKFVLSLFAAAILAGCGGGGGSGGTQAVKVQFSSQVSFGDALTDVGTYKVGTVAALRGGQFNINGATSADLTGKNWTELLATQLGLPAPCAAQTGLMGDASKGFNVPVVNHPECNGYGQGGARLFDNNGIGHNTVLGALTVPIATQIQTYLVANGNKFKSDSLILMTGGGSDISAQLAGLAAGANSVGQAAGAAEGARVGAQTFAATLVQSLAATATNPATAAQAIGLALATENARPGHTDQTVVGAAVTAAAQQPGNAAVASPAVFGPLVAAAQAAATTAGQAAGATAGAAAGAAYAVANAPLIVAEMGRLGAAFGNLVKNQVVANGANYVVVVNIPDVSQGPDALAASADQRALIRTMIVTFNEQLRLAVANEPKILYSDAFTANVDQIANPALHGLTNVKDRACDLSPAKNPLGSALVCNAGNLAAGDVSHYLFADGSSPTPFAYLLLARFVSKDMIVKGWL
jgi:phospholipase/lecithinase/hemolysin